MNIIKSRSNSGITHIQVDIGIAFDKVSPTFDCVGMTVGNETAVLVEEILVVVDVGITSVNYDYQ